jgi:hypothetical protein
MGDPERLRHVEVEHTGQGFSLRGAWQGTAGRVFQAAGVAVPPTVRQVARAQARPSATRRNPGATPPLGDLNA